MEPVIRACHLEHSFGEKTVLKDIHFEIDKGSVFGLLGPSGAGKTTMIKILTGQLEALGGEAYIFGKKSEEVKGDDFQKIGIMMDNFGLYERLNCMDNLKFYCKISGTETSRIKEVLDWVGLRDAGKTLVSNLSKGMRNRLLLARAILKYPQVLFLDEPTSGLDPKTVEEIHKLILQLQEAGTTIFLTTHNMAEAEKLCENIALLNEGNIIEFGSPKEICRKYNHQKQIVLHLHDGRDVVVEHNFAGTQKVVKLLQEGCVETIHSTEPNLETVFLELTGRKLE